MNEQIIIKKHKFWRKILIAGILVLIISLLAMAALYISGMNDAKAEASSEMEREIAELSAKSTVLYTAGTSTLPFAIVGSLMLNIARFRLRKLKEQARDLEKSTD